MEEYFLGTGSMKMEQVLTWLRNLLGSTCNGGKITRIIDWQIVPNGRLHEYSAFVRVEVQK